MPNTSSRRTFLNVKTYTLQTGKNDTDGLARNAAYDTQQQLRQGQDTQGIQNNRPRGSKAGDLTSRFGPGPTLAIAMSDGKGNWREVIIPMNMVGNDAIARPTGGGTVDVEARAALDSILDLLESLTVINT